jgi:hypothetical protein
MWLQPNSFAIRRTPHPNDFSRSVVRQELAAKAKGADPLIGPAEAPPIRASEIIPEWRAKSSWNAGRDQIGTVGEIIADSRATSPGFRKELERGLRVAPSA